MSGDEADFQSNLEDMDSFVNFLDGTTGTMSLGLNSPSPLMGGLGGRIR